MGWKQRVLRISCPWSIDLLQEDVAIASELTSLVLLVLLAALIPAAATASSDAAAGGPAGAGAMTAPPDGGSGSARHPYRGHSDEELTALAASWDSLNQHQRRALLTEMKLRMARGGERQGVLRIRTERRYGRIIRQSDGRLIRIETQVVHVRPVTEDDVAESPRGFGVGFEQRVRRREAAAAPDEREAALPPIPLRLDAWDDPPAQARVRIERGPVSIPVPVMRASGASP